MRNQTALPQKSVMDTEQYVIAEGSYVGGLSWLVWAQRQPLCGAQTSSRIAADRGSIPSG